MFLRSTMGSQLNYLLGLKLTIVMLFNSLGETSPLSALSDFSPNVFCILLRCYNYYLNVGALMILTLSDFIDVCLKLDVISNQSLICICLLNPFSHSKLSRIKLEIRLLYCVQLKMSCSLISMNLLRLESRSGSRSSSSFVTE